MFRLIHRRLNVIIGAFKYTPLVSKRSAVLAESVHVCCYSRHAPEEVTPPKEVLLRLMGATFTCTCVYGIFKLGKPRVTEDGHPVPDGYSNMFIIKQYIMRTIDELEFYLQLIKEPSREKILPEISTHPFYKPQYTLVLEFKDLLVHAEWSLKKGWRYKKRPGLDHFLRSLRGIYEIVIYTTERGATVFGIMEALDPEHMIDYVLVRDSTLYVNGKHYKELGKLNRDLKKVIVIDWNGKSTKYHRENVLKIPRWFGNDDDLTLIHLTSFLLTIYHNQIYDIREVVTNFSQFDDPLGTFRMRQKQLIDLAEVIPPE